MKIFNINIDMSSPPDQEIPFEDEVNQMKPAGSSRQRTENPDAYVNKDGRSSSGDDGNNDVSPKRRKTSTSSSSESSDSKRRKSDTMRKLQRTVKKMNAKLKKLGKRKHPRSPPQEKPLPEVLPLHPVVEPSSPPSKSRRIDTDSPSTAFTPRLRPVATQPPLRRANSEPRRRVDDEPLRRADDHQSYGSNPNVPDNESEADQLDDVLSLLDGDAGSTHWSDGDTEHPEVVSGTEEANVVVKLLWMKLKG